MSKPCAFAHTGLRFRSCEEKEKKDEEVNETAETFQPYTLDRVWSRQSREEYENCMIKLCCCWRVQHFNGTRRSSSSRRAFNVFGWRKQTRLLNSFSPTCHIGLQPQSGMKNRLSVQFLLAPLNLDADL
jgi:hypothetical protein